MWRFQAQQGATHDQRMHDDQTPQGCAWRTSATCHNIVFQCTSRDCTKQQVSFILQSRDCAQQQVTFAVQSHDSAQQVTSSTTQPAFAKRQRRLQKPLEIHASCTPAGHAEHVHNRQPGQCGTWQPLPLQHMSSIHVTCKSHMGSCHA
jgi:hypothetical protein